MTFDMKIIKTVHELREWRHKTGDSVGFVPTMGNLHQGHLSLIKASVTGNDHTALSVFVNPTQFNNQKDFDTYPHTLSEDLSLVENLGVTVVFAPSAFEMYPTGYAHKIVRASDHRVLCDVHRPGHFDGVLTVVNKLFSLVRPKRAYFGEKDYQQLKYIEEMSRDFFCGVEIVRGPTVREPSGLAMSSRNSKLSAAGREKAAKVYHWIHYQKLDLDELSQRLKHEGMELEYFEDHWDRRFVAFWVEGIRLIDNIPLEELV